MLPNTYDFDFWNHDFLGSESKPNTLEPVSVSDGEDVESERRSSTGSLKSPGGTVEGKKKPRVTLARGGACVNCRTRKLKCSGERPCKTCKKTGTQCKYEEVQRRRPRAVLMEERVVELETLLSSSGIPVPPSPLHPYTPPSTDSGSSTRVHPPQAHVSANASFDIAPTSALETALIHVVLPHTPYLSIPLHASRFLLLVGLPVGHPCRPHPALMYILFAEAVRVLENNTPIPVSRSLPPGLFPYENTPSIQPARYDRNALLSQVHGTSLSLLERARRELQEGIMQVDRPFDLVRAAVGIARYLYSLGRFIEGWGVPVARLAISCGLHRISGTIVSPPGEVGTLPPPYASTQYYTQAIVAPPRLRLHPTILPPARDAIDIAERTATWWAVKAQDWSAGVGWGWVAALNDADCTTRWPWGWGSVQISTEHSEQSIADLYSPSLGTIETTHTLATQSLCLLHRASDLFDTTTPFITECNTLEAALEMFRARIPPAFAAPPKDYDGHADPWWIQLHANLFTAEVLLYSELGRHRAGAYERAIRSARALVPHIARITQWAHVDMIVAIDTSLVARFLNKEATRLVCIGQPDAARRAARDAEVLRVALERDFAPWMPMAALHAMIVQRVKDGWSEKEGEYERV